MPEEEQKPVGHGLPDAALLATLGRIALRHGQLDNAMRMMVKDLTAVTKDEALDATAHNSSRELGQRGRRLARQRFGDGSVLVRVEALLHRAEVAALKRNELVHSVWGTELDGGAVIRNDDNIFQSPPAAKELETIAEASEQLILDITEARLDGFLREALAQK